MSLPTFQICLRRVRAMAGMSDSQLDGLAALAVVGSIDGGSRSAYATGVMSFARFLLLRGKRDLIPPDDPLDLNRWLLAFKSHNTGAQYLAHIKKACAVPNVGVAWWPENCRVVLRNSKYARVVDEASEARPVFRREQVQKMEDWGLEHWPAFAYLALFCFAFGHRAAGPP